MNPVFRLLTTACLISTFSIGAHAQMAQDLAVNGAAAATPSADAAAARLTKSASAQQTAAATTNNPAPATEPISYNLSAQQVVARYVEAMGGKEKLQAINSLYQEGTAAMSSGGEISIKTWRVFDRLYRQEVKFDAASVTVIVTPGKGWASSPRTNGEYKSLPDDQLKALQPQIDPAGPLVDYAAKGCRVDRDGMDTISGNVCYRIKLSCPRGQYAVYSIDAKTFYILRETRPGSGLMGGGNNSVPLGAAVISGKGSLSSITLDYSDYRKGPGGYIFPYSIEASGIGAKAKIDKILVNSSFDADALSRPKFSK